MKRIINLAARTTKACAARSQCKAVQTSTKITSRTLNNLASQAKGLRMMSTYANVKVTNDHAPVNKDMFCFQCEQTQDQKGCTTLAGVCGKTADTAALQDLLLHQMKGISHYINQARLTGADLQGKDATINNYTLRSVFSTLTNVNFDAERMVEYINEGNALLKQAKDLYTEACKSTGKTPSAFDASEFEIQAQGKTMEQLIKMGEESASILKRKARFGDDVVGLQELITYGLKGLCAYAEHAYVLGKQDPAVFQFVHEALDYLTRPNPTAEELLGIALKAGQINLRVMQLLEEGGTSKYGNPVPTPVRITTVTGKCILVSGHDLRDLEHILKQTEGTGINVYTHGELLPAHAYPELKKYKHLVGNYGGAWQLQKFDFATFPGPIVMTTNCIVEPKKSYKHRIFTRSVVGWPGVQHITNDDYKPVIDMAMKCEGFAKDEAPKHITVGFGKNTLLSVADKILDAVKAGQIKHFFLIGGCDGSEGERNYFRDLALSTPKDSVILTLGCGKYRFNKYDFGNIGPFPRLLDMGQCNDAYGAIQVAVALSQALNIGVNDLPLSFAVSWFEQKAVAVLLTLLSLGIKNIHLGPHLPAFVTPNMLNLLVEKFNLKPINLTIKDELADMLAKK